MYGNITEGWRLQVEALQVVVLLNEGEVAEHLTAQLEGYELAIRSLEGKVPDLVAAREAIILLEEAYVTLRDTSNILKAHEKELKTIAETVSVCIATLRRALPKEVPHEEAPSDT